MLTTRIAAGMLTAGMTVLFMGTACGQSPSSGSAQAFPEKPVRLIGSLPGGGSDLIMRLIAPSLRNTLGQPVIIENRPVFLLGEIGSKTPPDGYAMFVVGTSFMIGHLLRETTWDPLRDFAPVTLADAGPGVLIVHPSLPVKSVRDLIALAKSKPGQLNYASGPPGSAAHLAAELFKGIAGVNLVWVPFKSQGLGIVSMMTGETQVMLNSAAGTTPFMKSGQVRALAVTTAQPSPLLPGLPTLASSGVPGYESLQTDAVVVPAKTPAAIISRLNQEVVRALNLPEVKEALMNTGVVVVGNSPEEFGKFMKAEVVKWGKVIKDAGIKAE